MQRFNNKIFPSTLLLPAGCNTFQKWILQAGPSGDITLSANISRQAAPACSGSCLPYAEVTDRYRPDYSGEHHYDWKCVLVMSNYSCRFPGGTSLPEAYWTTSTSFLADMSFNFSNSPESRLRFAYL